MEGNMYYYYKTYGVPFNATARMTNVAILNHNITLFRYDKITGKCLLEKK
ncbi:hypothetical protein KKA15_05865 [Patescibacteria group bacterium]|nr:hypothetical protein [Patescibacteria group bacterium]